MARCFSEEIHRRALQKWVGFSEEAQYFMMETDGEYHRGFERIVSQHGLHEQESDLALGIFCLVGEAISVFQFTTVLEEDFGLGLSKASEVTLQVIREMLVPLSERMPPEWQGDLDSCINIFEFQKNFPEEKLWT